MKSFLTVVLFVFTNILFGQSSLNIQFNKEYSDISVGKFSDLNYILKLTKKGIYQIFVLQRGIDVVLELTDKNNNKILEKDSPNGQNGLESFEYSPEKTDKFFLRIKRLEEKENPDSGKVIIKIKKLSSKELKLREKIKKELEPENKKNVQTLDIDHFWEAFDNFKNCISYTDSVKSFQTIYLDKATDGLKDFITRRNFTAEKFVWAVSTLPKFYNSIRKNTYEVKKAQPQIENIFSKFKEIYPNFKPFKVCFAIGMVSTGGTVSDNFVLIGSEIATATKQVDISEFGDNALGKLLSSNDNIINEIKNIVAHECVHTQQKKVIDTLKAKCKLLYDVMREGFCDFIGELVVGGNINQIVHQYGNEHENEIWQEFKSEMYNEGNVNNWLYNYLTVKNKPADLGYYIGYKIAQAYYKNAIDKKQAIVDIIEMQDPIKLLELSKYDQKEKQTH